MQTTTHAERTYHANCAANAHTQRLAAEACNDLLTGKEATALAIIVEALPVEAPQLIETIFESRGWPADAVDETWLTSAGRVVWRAYCLYRGEATNAPA